MELPAIELAMPVGLPTPGTSPSDHWAALGPRLLVQLDPQQRCRLVSADEALYSGVYAMARGLLRYEPALPVLNLKPWLWDHLALRNGAGPAQAIPSLITVANLDAATIADAIAGLLASGPRFSGLSVDARADARVRFLAGEVGLLVEGGTYLGRGRPEPAPAGAGFGGNARRVDLSFLDSSGQAIAPMEIIGLWDLIGGPLVNGHPLSNRLSAAVTPGVCPVEGGIRVRIAGNGWQAVASVTVGAAEATGLRVLPDGSAIYATLPPGPEGLADLSVQQAGRAPVAFAAAVRYATDTASSGRAAFAGLATFYREVVEHANQLAAANALDDQERYRMELEIERAPEAAAAPVLQRAAAGGGPVNAPGAAGIWQQLDLLRTRRREALAALR